MRQTLTYNPYKYGRDFAGESINGETRAKQFVYRVTYIIHPDNYVRRAKISRHANTSHERYSGMAGNSRINFS